MIESLSDPWCSIVIKIEFPNDENTFVTRMPVFSTDNLDDKLLLAKDYLLQSFVKDAAHRSKERYG
jgi:hypothetical protein